MNQHTTTRGSAEEDMVPDSIIKSKKSSRTHPDPATRDPRDPSRGGGKNRMFHDSQRGERQIPEISKLRGGNEKAAEAIRSEWR